MNLAEPLEELVTAGDLPAINRILQQGDQVLIVPIKDGKRAFRIKREEITPLNRAETLA